MNSPAITATNLTKIYKLYNDPMDRLKESLSPFRKKYHRDFYALKNISFEINKGETVGIIGKNGSGKSTLLKIITGVLTPTKGEVETNGKVSALLELGAGFNPEMTGLENVYFSGTLMGYNKEEIDKIIDEIIEFADIGEFINQPMKSYSSGMYVRLAFSVATSINPEILIVDEALAVGDIFFQAKCIHKMKKMIDNEGTTLLFVSHDTGAVKSLCQKSILLNKGEIFDFDHSDSVVEKYFALKIDSEQKTLKDDEPEKTKVEVDPQLQEAFKADSEFQKRATFQRSQNGMAEFSNIQLLDTNYNPVHSLVYNQSVVLRMAVEIHEDIELLAYGYHIKDINGVDVIYSDSPIENHDIRSVRKGDKFIIDWKFRMSLCEGNYTIKCVLSIPIDLETGKVTYCDNIPIASQFEMQRRKPTPLYGLSHWNNIVEVKKVEL